MSQQLPTEQTETQRRGGLVLSTFLILLIPVMISALTLAWLLTGAVPIATMPEPRFVPLIPIVVITIFTSALIILVRLGRPTIGAMVMIGVWTIFTTATLLRSGVTDYSPASLILPICAAGLLFDRVASISLAVVSIILVGSIAWLQSRGWLITPDAPAIVFQVIESNQYGIAFGFWAGLFAAVAALTSLLAGGLQQALQRSRAQAEALQTLSNELEARVVAQAGALVAQEREAAMLAERTRLAREIHDTIAQGLAGVAVQLAAAQRAMQVAPTDAGEHLYLAQQLARESLAEARRSVWNLRAGVLERGSLVDALRSLAEQHGRSGVQHHFVEQGQPWYLINEIEGVLLRVAQEGLANVAKHASASEVTLTLVFQPDAVQLSIHDNGTGFEAEILNHAIIPQQSGGFGLLGMRERLAALGGNLELRNDGGAMVIATIPR
jgi:signal transduction histidine kinase